MHTPCVLEKTESSSCPFLRFDLFVSYSQLPDTVQTLLSLRLQGPPATTCKAEGHSFPLAPITHGAGAHHPWGRYLMSLLPLPHRCELQDVFTHLWTMSPLISSACMIFLLESLTFPHRLATSLSMCHLSLINIRAAFFPNFPLIEKWI